MRQQLHTLKTFTPEDVSRILQEMSELAAFIASEHARQWNHEENLVAETEFNVNPVPPFHNFHWRGNERSLTTFFQGVRKHEIFYARDEKTFRSRFGKNAPGEMFVIGKKKLSETIYLFRALAAPEVRLIKPEHWHKVLPLHFISDLEEVLSERCIAVRSSLQLEACVKSEKRREILDSIIDDAKWANGNR